MWDTIEAGVATEVTSTQVRELSFDAGDGNVYLPQGGWTDGSYHYQAYKYVPNSADETQNQIYIVKYSMENTDESGTKTTTTYMQLRHANDVTYNSKEQCFVVCYASPEHYKLEKIVFNSNGTPTRTVINLRDTITNTTQANIYSIDYNATRDCYVVGMSNGYCQILNSNFERISGPFKTFEFRVLECDTCGKEAAFNYQGVSCDDRYIYFIMENTCVSSVGDGLHPVKTDYDGKNRIAVYDWDGNFKHWIILDNDRTDYEPENLTVIDHVIYYAAWDKAYETDYTVLFKVEF